MGARTAPSRGGHDHRPELTLPASGESTVEAAPVALDLSFRMTTWIAGTEESTIVAVGGALPGRGTAAPPPREPAGAWHAVDRDSGTVACGTTRFLETWPDHPWTEAGVADRCPECLAAVPLT